MPAFTAWEEPDLCTLLPPQRSASANGLITGVPMLQRNDPSNAMKSRRRAVVYIRRARDSDCDLLAANARMSDTAEVSAVVGALGIAAAARFALSASERAWSVFADRKLVCIYGVGRESVLVGGRQPWLLGTCLIEVHARQFAARSRAILADLVAKYGVLENKVDARNLGTIRWLRFLGFEISAPEPYGYSNMPFHRFRIEPPCASRSPP